MKFPTIITAVIASAATLGAAPAATAGDVNNALRGATAIPENSAAPPLANQAVSDSRIPRTFTNQPPLIPHDIEDLDIGGDDNACLQCHERAQAADAGAPAAAASHYRDRAGNPLQHLARGRWFCTQCHVPQADVRPLVRNEFTAAE